MPGLVPIVHLQTKKHTQHNDQRLNDDSEPVLLADGSGETALDHNAATQT